MTTFTKTLFMTMYKQLLGNSHIVGYYQSTN